VGKVLGQKEKLKLGNDDMLEVFNCQNGGRKKIGKKRFQISILGFHCVAKNIRA